MNPKLLSNAETRDGELSIGKVSKLLGISVKTLHYYDNIGLLKPRGRKDSNNYRYYTQEDIRSLLVIKYYQESGLSLSQIKEFLAADDLPALIAVFEDVVSQKEEELKAMQISKDSMVAWKKLLVEGELLREQKPEISIKKLRTMKTLSEGMMAESQGQLRTKTLETGQRCYGAVFHEYTDAAKRSRGEETFYIRHMEIHPLCFFEVDYSTLGDWACISQIHFGSYDTVGKTYDAMFRWAEENHLHLQGNAVERLIIDSSSMLPESAYVTEILLPLE